MTNIHDAFEAIPGYTEEKALQESLRKTDFELEPARLEEALDAFSAAWRKAKINGNPAPIEAAEAVLEARRRQEIIDLFNTEYKNQRFAGKNRLENILTNGIDAATTHLDEALAKLVEQVRQHERKLGGATTAGDAISNGETAIKAWQAITELVPEYEKIRFAQENLLLNNSTFETALMRKKDVLGSIALYRDAIDVSTPFIRRRRDAFRESSYSHQHVTWLNPRKTELRVDSLNNPAWWPDTDHTEALIRICLEAEPWIPTVDQIINANTAAFRATVGIQADVSAIPGRSPEREAREAEKALQRYRNITQGTPVPQDEPAPDGLSPEHHKIAARMEKTIKVQAADHASSYATQVKNLKRGRDHTL